MNLNRNIFSSFLLSVFFFHLQAQEWNLKLKSKVELRSWMLTNKALKTEKNVEGATITLMKNEAVLGQTQSDLDGNFEMDIPGNGHYTLTVAYPNCTTKKFSVSTTGVPDKSGFHRFSPSVTLGSFMLSKPVQGVDYIGLADPIAHVEYKPTTETFDKDAVITGKGMIVESKIMDAENLIIEKFCNLNKKGDDALNKKNYAVAKSYYEQALAVLPGEEYPKDRLKRAEDGMKEKESIADAKKEEDMAKSKALKEANDKAAAEKNAKEKAQFTQKVTGVPNTSNTSTSTPSESASPTSTNVAVKTSGDKGKVKYKMSNPIGHDPYRESIDKADNYYKTKRYTEAKAEYEQALKVKPKDAYALKKLEETKKLLGFK